MAKHICTHVNMVFTDYSFENLNVFRIANLHNQFPTSLLNVAFQHMVPLLGDPDNVSTQARHTMTTVSVFVTHTPNLTGTE